MAQVSQRSSVIWDHSHLIGDTRLIFHHCDKYISSSLANHSTPHVHPTQSPSHLPRGTLSDFLSQEISFLTKAFDEDAYVALYDVEQAIQQGIDDWVARTTDIQQACEQLRILSDAYLSGAEKIYTNPEHHSIMFLTLVELWVALDQLLLKQDHRRTLHAPIVSIDALERLLLHKTSDLHRLSRAYQYLSARHSQASKVRPDDDLLPTGWSFERYLNGGGNHSSHVLVDGPYEDSNLQIYVDETTHTTNDVLSMQSGCHTDLTLPEFIAFGCLRSGSSLQWINILRELRCRNLNFRRPEVYLLFAQAATHVGPLTSTGELVWHQELQDPSFCHALVNELESLFVDVGVGSSDGAAMGIISLLTRLLVSNSCEDVSEKAIRLLRHVREKTFDWMHELLYDAIDSPADEKRNKPLRDMAAICRSTFDVNPTAVRKLLHSPQDIEVAVSCAIIIHTVMFIESPDTCSYGRLLLERDRRLGFALEQALRDAIQNDVSDTGIDLAIRKIWPGYRPGPHRWKSLRFPNSRWLVCETAETKDRYSQRVSVDLLRGSVVVDGMPMGGRLSSTIKEDSTYRRVFGKVGARCSFC
ncbi:hypothetical protein JVU11DRAFT_7804 [Chiua virens]|nr:hypothetical protein JVU11DRAFT_7804 [Chiua virens]